MKFLNSARNWAACAAAVGSLTAMATAAHAQQTVEQIKQRGRQAYAKATNDEERARIAALVEELKQAALASV